jgi:hypothetical protein
MPKSESTDNNSVDTTTKEHNTDSVHEPRSEKSNCTVRGNHYLDNERTFSVIDPVLLGTRCSN